MPPKPAPSFDGGGVNGTAVLVTSSGWSPVDKTNLPLLASLASFCGVAAIFILYALLMRRHTRSRAPPTVGTVLADGTIWGMGGRRGKYRAPVGPPPQMKDVWISTAHAPNVQASTSWSEIQPVSVVHMNSSLSIPSQSLPPLTNLLREDSTTPPRIPEPARSSARRPRWRWLNRRQDLPLLESPTEPASAPPTNLSMDEKMGDPHNQIQDVDVAVLVAMPVPPSARAQIQDAEELGPLLVGVTRTPMRGDVSTAPADLRSNL